MNLFLDTNVILDYLAAREPFCHDIRKIILESNNRNIDLYASSVTFTTIEYILKKYMSHEELMHKFELLRKFIKVPPTDGGTIDNAIKSNFKDFEDAVQYFTSFDKCDVIITRNTKDFKQYSQIPILTPKEFLSTYK